MKHIYLFILTLISLSVCGQSTISVPYNNQHIVYEGRVIKNTSEKATEIYWPGTSIQLDFEGEAIKGIFEGNKSRKGAPNAEFNVFVDGEFKNILVVELGKKTYDIATNLSNEKHTLLLTKRNEWTSTKTKFYGFEIEGQKVYEIENQKSLFIEFYGDSITCGLGNEDPTKADAISNNYKAYGAVTARNLNAEYSCIARSGIGLMVSWYNLIMPEMYDLTNPYDKNKKWDFTKKQPDIVVINLLQNDSWIVNNPKNKEYIRRFGNKGPSDKKYAKAYNQFIKRIKGHYPDAKIICMLGNMNITKKGSKWPALVEKVVNNFKGDHVYFLNSPYLKANGHPKVKEHQKSAELLTNFIKLTVLK